MDGSEVAVTGATERLTGLVKALQTVNGTTWHDTFLGLWISALRLVQREELEECEFIDESDCSQTNQKKEKQAPGKCRKDLVSSLRMLNDYEALLTPQSVRSAANQAAAKAIMFVSGFTVVSNVLLVGISSVDCVQTFSLHVMVPILAGMLMPLCKVFRTTAPDVSWTLPTGEKLTSHALFTNAFTLLLRLWSLTACAHGRLSPRELATGLKDLADFLPATLATIVSYLSAEVTVGTWKPAFMNGSDWPSPATSLSTIEQQINKVIAATGVDVSSLTIANILSHHSSFGFIDCRGSSPAMLPLPLAALVSLTITYKLEKASERFLVLIDPALNSLAEDCPWPCMPIIASLWTQKFKRWNDFLVFSASQTVFHHSSDAVVQLLRSCFTSTLGLNPSTIYSNGGVGAFLGHGFGSHFSGGMSPVSPVILYDSVFSMEKLKTTKFGLSYGQVSLGAAMERVKLAALLRASLVWLSGGLSLVQPLIKETLPSWFISSHSPDHDHREPKGVVAMLRGYALAYFVVLCGTFAWGVDLASPASKRRPKVLRSHFGVSCKRGCTQMWVLDVDADVLKRLSYGLMRWNKEELAMALLGTRRCQSDERSC
ncbi:Mediator of RNA polymerase II transcription subunit 33A [Hibiscus syriacus]|uniref:Mediator of RNA polymerase II transcription subunit 33A n=1 Tax=Hibiscus syriacus TaxID=106335 RepID=A0A6A3AE58_HIBSY|nr:Mediator of RNA polymerase II transcription subunit 33A [Hibiscus syriacus]